MREIFRVWDSVRKEMYYLETPGEYPENVRMQYTGQPDKNGRKIYDGDILLSATGERYIVIWENDGWRRESIDKIQSRTGLFPHSRHQEIIGNIYENADLIKHFKLTI